MNKKASFLKNMVYEKTLQNKKNFGNIFWAENLEKTWDSDRKSFERRRHLF